MNEKMKKFAEIIKDEALAKELFAIKKPEDAQKWLKDHGADFSVDEIKTLVEKARASEEGELSDKELKSVSGGEGNYITWEAEALDFIIEWVKSWFD